jgi:hypothetical protein
VSAGNILNQMVKKSYYKQSAILMLQNKGLWFARLEDFFFRTTRLYNR